MQALRRPHLDKLVSGLLLSMLPYSAAVFLPLPLLSLPAVERLLVRCSGRRVEGPR